MSSISEQRQRELDVKIKRENELKQILEEQRRKMEEIMARMDNQAREQMSSSSNAARKRRGKESVMSNIEAELEAQKMAVDRCEELHRAARQEREQWEAWSKA
jgi:hypothetical protein